MTIQTIKNRHQATKHATRLAFLMAGFSMAAWAPLVPFAKERAALESGELGILLLGLGLGSSLTMPLTGVLVNRFGCKHVFALATLLIMCSLPLLTVFNSFALLLLTLAIFGAGVGMADCVVNIQAVRVENATQENLMSGFHGLFSLGNVVGAAGIAGLISLGLTPLMAILCGLLVIIATFLFSYPNCLAKVDNGGSTGKFMLPKGAILFLAVLSFIGFLLEGAMLDWSGVFLVEQKALSVEYAGWGYVVFAICITLSRLSGHYLSNLFHYKSIITTGAVLAMVGLLMTVYLSDLKLVFVGYGLIGLGIANLVPILFSLAGKQQVMPQSVAIPILTTVGYAGVLLGPAIIGFWAEFSSLASAFLAITGLIAVVAVNIQFYQAR